MICAKWGYPDSPTEQSLWASAQARLLDLGLLQVVFNKNKTLAREVQLVNAADISLSIMEPLTGTKVRG